MKIDRRIIQNFDWITLGIVILLTLLGIMTIYSATRSPLPGSMMLNYPVKQLYWFLIGLAALFLMASFDYIWLKRCSYIFYGVGIGLLLMVLFLGRTGMGAQRWLNLGFFSFQPSEIFKLIFIITLVRYLTEIRGRIGLLLFIKIFFALACVPVVLLIRQPDLGTAVVMMLLFLSIMAAKGLQKKVVTVLVVIGLVSIPFIGNILWEGLKDYQKNRLVAFLDPHLDPSGIGYHIQQSKIAVGSGQSLGKGYLQGTQGPFRFLPEKHTDFIFSVFAEEWGFIGSCLLLVLYLALILRALDTARKAKDEFGSSLALGIAFMFTIYFVVNIGMTIGIMPVVGIPLPFMSYGGTALLANFIATGVLINIRTRRFELFY